MQFAPGIILTTAALLALTIGCERKKRRIEEATDEKTEEKKTEAKGPAGITDDEIVLGMSSSFQGSAAEIGIESYRGAMAYFAEVNANGGVNGRKLRIIPMDDSYDGAKAAANTETLLKDRNAFVLFSAGGTANTNGIVKVLAAQKEPNIRDQAFLFGSTSGAQSTRQLPNSQWVYHVRTSINQTTRAAVEAFIAGGKKKIGVFAQDDDFGQAVIDGARLAANDLKTTIAAEAKQPKGQKFEVSTAEQVKALKTAGCDAVILGANYQPEAAFIRDAVDDNWNVAFAITTGESTMLRTLKAHEAKTTKNYTKNPVLAPIVVPDVEETSFPAVTEYRSLMDKRNPQVPEDVRDPNYKLTQYNGRGLEAFLQAKIFHEALKRAGRELTRAKLRTAIESIKDWDVGLRTPVTYGTGDNQAFDRVFLLTLKDGKWTAADTQTAMAKNTPAPAMAGKAAGAGAKK